MTNKPKHSGRAHAKLSASGSHRWLKCTAAPSMEEKHGLDNVSRAAEEGTLAHEIAELTLTYRLGRCSDAVYEQGIDWYSDNAEDDLFSHDMVKHAEDYADYVIGRYNEVLKDYPDARIYIEKRVIMSEFIPEGFGTPDAAIVADNFLLIIDYKYGMLWVYAENNPQLKLYGLGFVSSYSDIYDFDVVQLEIYQPRLQSIQTWQTDTKDLLKWAKSEVKPVAKEAFEGPGELKAGKWCTYCTAAHVCKAMAAEAQRAARNDFRDPDTLSDEQLISAFEAAEQSLKWFRAVEEYLLARLVKGERIPGLKKVRGRSSRKWVLEPTEIALELLESGLLKSDQVYERKLANLTTIESAVGKKAFVEEFSHLFDKSLGKLKLALEEDARPEVNFAKEDFT